MKFFDTCISIHDIPEEFKGGYAGECIEMYLDKLSEELNRHDIKHVYILPTYDEIVEDAETSENPNELRYKLYYDSDKHVEICHVIALFCREYYKYSAERILKTVTKVLNRVISAE